MATIRRRRKGAPSAPAAPASPLETERRINEVHARIVCSLWVPGVTARELAEEWGVEVATVQGYYTEARRSLVRAKREHSHLFEVRLEAMISAAMGKGDIATAMKGLSTLKDWKAQRDYLKGKTGGGLSIAELEASRKAAENNERDD